MWEEKGPPRPCAGGKVVWELDAVVVKPFSPGTRPGGNAEAIVRPPPGSETCFRRRNAGSVCSMIVQGDLFPDRRPRNVGLDHWRRSTRSTLRETIAQGRAQPSLDPGIAQVVDENRVSGTADGLHRPKPGKGISPAEVYALKGGDR